VNAWGIAFLAPFVALIFIDPTYMIPAIIGLVVFMAAMLWLVNKIIGPKK
jgi:hypothetical protein